MPKQPLAEVFGFPITNLRPDAQRYRSLKLCPFHNRVPNCTKDKAENPLGVCSILDGENIVITCPVRFRQDWLIAEDAARFFFAPSTTWTSLVEVRLNDATGKSAGNIDMVLVAYDQAGRITDFGALEVQAVYISGNIRRAFEFYMEDPAGRADMDWTGKPNYPRPDFLSSSRKRLAPQLIYKGGILKAWNKKTAVALDRGFFATLPKLPQVAPEAADMAWLVYDLVMDGTQNSYRLSRYATIYTTFEAALDQITKPAVGDLAEFVHHLQRKLDEKLNGGSSPDTSTIEVNL
jgi:hypothetical protein